MSEKKSAFFAGNSSPDVAAAMEVEVAKRQKAEKRKEVHQKFFAGNKKKSKLSSSEKFVKSIQIQPLLRSPETPAALKRIGKVGEHKYQKYIRMSEDGVKLQLPPIETLERHDHLLARREQLKRMVPEPDDYLQKQQSIQNELDCIYPSIVEMRNNVAEAAEAFHTSVHHRCVCKEKDDLVGLKEWSRIVDALVCLGIDTIINELRMAHEEKKKLGEEEKLGEEAQLTKAAVGKRNDTVVLANMNQENAVNDEGANDEMVVQDKDGNWVPIDSIMKKGTAHDRQRPIADRKKTKRSGAITRRGLIKVTPYEMSRDFYRSWLKKQWTSVSKTKDPATNQYITRSGPNKFGHGMVLKNNKFLHCELCDCAVSKKFGQHLAGEVHHVRFEKAKKKVIDADAKEGETELEASSRLLNEAVDSLINQREKEDLAGASLPKSVTVYRMQVHELQLMNNMPSTMQMGVLLELMPKF